MRFESATAHAFGPFVERRLEFGDGLTLIYGPNEAGKSTWHAVLFAALCGLRRGKGPGPPKTEPSASDTVPGTAAAGRSARRSPWKMGDGSSCGRIWTVKSAAGRLTPTWAAIVRVRSCTTARRTGRAGWI